ncbi:MAG: Uma2 family endonuclease [Gemmatimonadetes bacterium]|nr:Uma2 family endonuclease [Gemmatimonadota bacterium]
MSKPKPAPTRAESRALTLHEFQELPDDGYHRDELVRGRLVREPPPNDEHGWLAVRLARFLSEFVEEHDLGIVMAETGFVLTREPPTVRAPDLAVVRRPRAKQFARSYIEGAPDLAVEILSPSNTAPAMQEKVRDYLEEGAKMVWVVDPGPRTVSVHRSGQEVQTLRIGDDLDGGAVLPGFRLPLAKLFAY